MAILKKINNPPDEILNPPFRKNYELIILWMLNNNKVCSWSDLLIDGHIKRSTLSLYLKKLIEKEYINKLDFNSYNITTLGKERFYEIAQAKKRRTLSFPPKIILKKRAYKDWILWMLYNNNYCKWADFLEDPLRINQSSLSKSLKFLLDKNFIKKEEKKYKITNLGKNFYSEMLKKYDLDRQSILEEESKRIKLITKDVIRFFKKYKINENHIRFRFLNNVLKLPYEKIDSNLTNKEDFYKILLFLSINHPSDYPKFTSLNDFSKEYKINTVTIEFYIQQIVEKSIFPIKFFTLEVNNDCSYYFQSNEKLEKILNAVTEEYITQLSYLNSLFEELPEEKRPLTLESTIEDIAEEVCKTIFNSALKESLMKLLPKYIQYLAFKIEKKKKIVNIYDKLQSLIWREMDNLQFNLDKKDQVEDYGEALKSIEEAIDLDTENLNLYYSKEQLMLYFNKYDELLDFLDEMLNKFPNELKNIELKKAFVLKEKRKLEEGLEIINSLIQQFPEDNHLICYKAYWMQYLNLKKEALKIMESLINNEPKIGIFHDNYGEMLMAFGEYNLAINEFKKAIELSSGEWFIFQSYLKLGICYKELDEFDLALENLKLGIKFSIKSKMDPTTKEKWTTIGNLFINEIEQIELSN